MQKAQLYVVVRFFDHQKQQPVVKYYSSQILAADDLSNGLYMKPFRKVDATVNTVLMSTGHGNGSTRYQPNLALKLVLSRN